MISVSVENREQLETVLSVDEVNEVIICRDSFLDDEIINIKKDIEAKNKKPVLNLEEVTRYKDFNYNKNLSTEKDLIGIINSFDKIMINNIDQFFLILNNVTNKDLYFNYNMHIYNKSSKEFYKKLVKGTSINIKFIAPIELNKYEINEIEYDGIIVYSYIKMMISKNCIYKNFDRCRKNQIDIIKDRYDNNVIFKSYCKFCYNKIFNTIPLDIRTELSNINIKNYIYFFTVENRKEIYDIISHNRDLAKKTKGHIIKSVI